VSTGAVTEIGTTILGTDFRGARQHWGWKTAFDDTSLPAMGDVYQ
jgi:hypothetical protein